MKITLIKREKPYLVRYFLDNGTDFAIDLDLANELCLKQEDTLSIDKIAELKEESDYLRAKKRALWYLERSMRKTEFLEETDENGRMNYNSILPFVSIVKVSDRIIFSFETPLVVIYPGMSEEATLNGRDVYYTYSKSKLQLFK